MSDPRTTDFWTDRLSAYLDGELGNGERRAFEAHLAGCASCATALDELREVVARAREIEARLPAGDLWPRILARLEPRSGAGPGPGRATAPGVERGAVARPQLPWWRGRRVALGLPQLAAAGLALMLLSGGAVWLALSGRPGGRVPPSSPPVAAQAPAAPGGAAVAGFDVARYDATVVQLQQVVERHRGELDPRTVRIIEDNLRIIDRATAEARRALEADPANPYLNDHLVKQMRRKIDLLKQAAALANARG